MGPLRVEVAPSIADAELLPLWVSERHRRLGHALRLPGHEQWIAVEIAGETYDYEVTVTAVRDGITLDAVTERSRCECNSEALLHFIDGAVSDAVTQLRSTPATPVEPLQPESRSAASDRSDAAKGSMSILSVVGVGLGALGVVSLGGGAAGVLAGQREIRGSSRLRRNFGPPGVAALAAGGAAVVGGVTMVVVDLARCRKVSKQSCRRVGDGDRISSAVVTNSGHLGLQITGRF